MKHIYLLISFSIATGAFGTTYTTNFPLLENPIYEQGAWISGGVAGINWTNVRTTPGIALGTMPGNASGDAQYADSTAVLAGTWGPDQTAQATISVSNASDDPGVFEEVELRLRTTITPVFDYRLRGQLFCLHQPEQFLSPNCSMERITWQLYLTGWRHHTRD